MNNTYPRILHLSDDRQKAAAINQALRKTDALELSADQSTATVDRPLSITGNVDTTGVYTVATVQVVRARMTGWAIDTGTAKRTANATYAVGSALTVGAAYVQAEVTAIITRQALIEAALRDATQTIKALKDDLHGTAGHGIIGT